MSGGPDPPYVRARTALLDAADALAEQLDALEQALYARPAVDELVHHSDRGTPGSLDSLHRTLGGGRH